MTTGIFSSRIEIAARAGAGIIGSYVLAVLCVRLFDALGPVIGDGAEDLGEMIGFTLLGCAAILAFSVNRAAHGWIVIGGTAAILAILPYILGRAA